MGSNASAARIIGDPGIAAVVAAISALDPSAQHDIQEYLSELLTTGEVGFSTGLDARERRAITAVREVRNVLRDVPTRHAYDRLRAERAEHTWPSSRCVLRWLGVPTWAEAVARAGLAARPKAVKTTTQFDLGPAFTKRELVAALADCADALHRVPSVNDYISWARRPDVCSSHRPTSTAPFVRCFGSWPKALVATGVVALEVEAARRVNGTRRVAYSITEAQCVEALQSVAAFLGAVPGPNAYTRARDRIHAEADAAGTPRDLPGYVTFYRRFGSWEEALRRAGLDPRSRPPRRDLLSRRISRVALERAIRQAYNALSKPPTSNDYAAWRKSEIARDPLRAYELPSYVAAGSHGGWRAVVLTALAAVPPPGEPSKGTR